MLNQTFYRNMYTSMYRGTWNYGHNDLLTKYKVDKPGDRTLMVRVMDLASRRFAAELKTHYQEHFEQFYLKWRKMKGLGKDESGRLIHKAEYHLDPEDAPLNDLIHAAWQMLGELEEVRRPGVRCRARLGARQWRLR